MLKGKLHVGLINGTEKVVVIHTYDLNKPIDFINMIISKDYFTITDNGKIFAFRNSNTTHIYFEED